MEEELAEECKMGAWEWGDPVSEKSTLVIRHDGKESIEENNLSLLVRWGPP